MTTQRLNYEHRPPSTRTLLLGIWGHLNRRRRIQLGLLLVVMLASGSAELVSLGSVLPFLAVLSDPERLWQQPLVQVLASRAGFSQASELLLPATLAFAAAAVIAALIRLANLWLNIRLAAAVGSDLSCEAYRRTLYQSYAVHLQRNSAEVITGITSQIDATVAALNYLLQLITASIVATGLLTGLVLIDAPVAVAAAALFGSAYGVLAATARQKLRNNGYKIAPSPSCRALSCKRGWGRFAMYCLMEANTFISRSISRWIGPYDDWMQSTTFSELSRVTHSRPWAWWRLLCSEGCLFCSEELALLLSPYLAHWL